LRILSKAEALRCGELLEMLSEVSLAKVRAETLTLLGGGPATDPITAVVKRWSLGDQERVRFVRWCQHGTCQEVEELLCDCIELRRPFA